MYTYRGVRINTLYTHHLKGGDCVDLPDNIDWPDRTREWWQKWVEAPIVKDWTPLQWEFLLDTALLHATVWGSGDMSKLSELRTRTTLLGGLPGVEPAAKLSKAGKKSAADTAATAEGTPLDELAKRRKSRMVG